MSPLCLLLRSVLAAAAIPGAASSETHRPAQIRLLCEPPPPLHGSVPSPGQSRVQGKLHNSVSCEKGQRSALRGSSLGTPPRPAAVRSVGLPEADAGLPFCALCTPRQSRLCPVRPSARTGSLVGPRCPRSPGVCPPSRRSGSPAPLQPPSLCLSCWSLLTYCRCECSVQLLKPSRMLPTALLVFYLM